MIRTDNRSDSLVSVPPMSDSDPHSQLVEEASDWFARLRADDVTPDDHAAFDRWKAQSAAHLDAYESVSRLWDRLEQPGGAAWTEIDPAAIGQLERLSAASKLPRSRALIVLQGAGLAAVVAALAAGVWFWLPGALTLWQSDYATATGEQRQVTLADGSSVLLNTDSALSVQPWEGNRAVTILKGEAAFSVTSDPGKPFIVKAGPGEVRVVGTKFSVRTRPERVTVTVTEGIVTVGAGSHVEPVRIEAGEEVSYDAGGIGPVMKANVMKTLAWQRGQLVFTLESLNTVIEELNRYHSGAIVLANPALRTRMVNGVFATDDPMRVVNAVTKTLHVRSFSIADRFVLLY